MPLPDEPGNCPAAEMSSLFDYDGLDGALICSLLDGILELRRHFIHNDFCDFIAHSKDFRTGLDAKPAGRAAIVNFYLHNFPHTSTKI